MMHSSSSKTLPSWSSCQLASGVETKFGNREVQNISENRRDNVSPSRIKTYFTGQESSYATRVSSSENANGAIYSIGRNEATNDIVENNQKVQPEVDLISYM